MPKIFIGLKFIVVEGIEAKRLSGEYQTYIDRFIE
jgi:hypothetical protein